MNTTDHPQTRWSLAGALTAAIAASICCVGPLVLLALGVGGAWASKLTMLEPYRPIFMALTLGFLGFAFFRAYRSRGAGSCSPGGSCQLPPSSRLSRVALWVVSPLVLALLFSPYLLGRVHVHLFNCGGRADTSASADPDACCAAPAATPSEGQVNKPPKQSAVQMDPSHEVVFEVESLQCPAVKGVGCGSMLWPVLTQINQIDGVSDSFANWTGMRLRVRVASGTDRNAVAERVRQLLASEECHPAVLTGAEFSQALKNEDWHDAARLVDLSSYEFRTIAKRRLQAFVDSEKLDTARRNKLMNLVDQLWEKSAEGLDLPASERDAYGQYWRARLNRFVGAYAERARDVLSAEQVQQLLRQYQPPGTRSAVQPQPSGRS